MLALNTTLLGIHRPDSKTIAKPYFIPLRKLKEIE